jgi:hypothetical protein
MRNRLPNTAGLRVRLFAVRLVAVAGAAAMGSAALHPAFSEHSKRQAQTRCGEWLREEQGPFDSAAVTFGATRVGYAALNTMPQVLDSAAPLMRQIAARPPELVVLSRHRPPPHWDRALQSGQYRLLELPETMKPGGDARCDYVVLIRNRRSNHLAMTSR